MSDRPAGAAARGMAAGLPFRRPPGLTASVAICAYTTNRYEIMKRAVQAVLDQLDSGDELILVVDHSAELLALAQVGLPDLRIVENVNTRGTSGARNTAIGLARGDALVFLDDDAVPRAGWLEALLAPYADDDVIGVGGQLEPIWPARRPAWFPPEFLWVVGCSYEGLPNPLEAIRNPIGANMSFRREVVARVGGFDETLGRVGTLAVGCEETLLGIQATRLSPRSTIRYQPSAIVDHQVTPERTRFGYFRERCWLEGKSKAQISRIDGSRGTLSTERRYVFGTLRMGFVDQIRALVRGDVGGVLRATAILVGLMLTATGYLAHLWRGPAVP